MLAKIINLLYNLSNVGYKGGGIMIRALILYFLSNKPTHGYEIQKYIQLNQMNDWTKIQSGSIYYALAKLEKDDFIRLVREENIGKKIRKIYEITDKGILELKEVLSIEFSKPIYTIKADKFVTYLFVNDIRKEILIDVVNKHINKLEKDIVKLKKWQEIKINDKSLGIEKISFEMMISSLSYQIKWHEELLNEIDACIEISENIGRFIKNIDFSEINTLRLEEVNKMIYKK